MADVFRKVSRQSFREYFQPSRIVLLVVKSESGERVNVTTLCFATHAAYKPTSIAFALEKRHLSHELLGSQKRCVLAVPGRDLAEQSLICGTKSGRTVDKTKLPGMPLISGSDSEFVWVESAMANLQAEVTGRVDNGDHDVFVARVTNYYANDGARGPNLLSIGRDDRGFDLLARSGIHRIGIVTGVSS